MRIRNYSDRTIGSYLCSVKQISRHSFATHMLEKGVNLKRLQLLMGHNSMKTTSVYLHLADIDKVELPDLVTS